MIPNVDESTLTSEFCLKSTTPPKPEAPWIKRCDYGIKFTDEIQVLDNPSITETDESSNKDEDEKRGKKGSSDDDDDDQSGDDSGSNNDKLQSSLKKETVLNERYYMRNYVKE
jgi:hypothetical protein